MNFLPERHRTESPLAEEEQGIGPGLIVEIKPHIPRVALSFLDDLDICTHSKRLERVDQANRPCPNDEDPGFWGLCLFVFGEVLCKSEGEKAQSARETLGPIAVEGVKGRL